LFSVDCSNGASGKIIWVSSAPEKTIGYSKDEIKHIEIDSLLPDFLKDQHRKFFSEFQMNGISQKIFKRSIVAIIKKDKTCVISEMWLKPYLNIYPVKPVLLTMSRILNNKILCSVVTDGLGFVDSVTQEYLDIFDMDHGDSINNSIFFNAPDLLPFLADFSENFKHSAYINELSLNKSWTRISSSTDKREYMLKVDWFPRSFNPEELINSSIKYNFLKSEKSENQMKLLSNLRNLPRTSPDVYSVRLRINCNTTKTNESFFYLQFISISLKKTKTFTNLNNPLISINPAIIKQESIEAQLIYKQDEAQTQNQFTAPNRENNKINQKWQAASANCFANKKKHPAIDSPSNLTSSKNLVNFFKIVQRSEFNFGNRSKFENNESIDVLRNINTESKLDVSMNEDGKVILENKQMQDLSEKAHRKNFSGLKGDQRSLLGIILVLTLVFLVVIAVLFNYVY
jgi:hypothetical protein